MTDPAPKPRAAKPDSDYASTSQQRILKVLLALSGHEVNGLAPGEIAKGLKVHDSNITHDLRNLRLADMAEEIPGTGRWRLSPRVGQIAMDMLAGVDRAQRKVDEVRQRFTRTQR